MTANWTIDGVKSAGGEEGFGAGVTAEFYSGLRRKMLV